MVAAHKLSKTTPVKGLDKVALEPTSKRALAEAVGRTGIAAGLSTLIGVPAASKVEEIIHDIGYRRLVVALVAMVSATVVTVLVIVMVMFSTVLTALSYPLQVIETLFGSDSPEVSDKSVLTYCAIPSPDATGEAQWQATAEPPVPEGTVPVENGSIPVESSTAITPPPPSQLPAAVTPEGKPTQVVLDLMDSVPAKADPNRAEAYLLYSLTHPQHPSWDEFGTMYLNARDVLATRGADTRDEVSRETVPNASSVVREMDQASNIAPFTLVSASAVADMVKRDKITVSDEKYSTMINRVNSLCVVPDDTVETAAPTSVQQTSTQPPS